MRKVISLAKKLDKDGHGSKQILRQLFQDVECLLATVTHATKPEEITPVWTRLTQTNLHKKYAVVREYLVAWIILALHDKKPELLRPQQRNLDRQYALLDIEKMDKLSECLGPELSQRFKIQYLSLCLNTQRHGIRFPEPLAEYTFQVLAINPVLLGYLIKNRDYDRNVSLIHRLDLPAEKKEFLRFCLSCLAPLFYADEDPKIAKSIITLASSAYCPKAPFSVEMQSILRQRYGNRDLFELLRRLYPRETHHQRQIQHAITQVPLTLESGEPFRTVFSAIGDPVDSFFQVVSEANDALPKQFQHPFFETYPTNQDMLDVLVSTMAWIVDLTLGRPLHKAPAQFDRFGRPEFVIHALMEEAVTVAREWVEYPNTDVVTYPYVSTVLRQSIGTAMESDLDLYRPEHFTEAGELTEAVLQALFPDEGMRRMLETAFKHIVKTQWQTMGRQMLVDAEQEIHTVSSACLTTVLALTSHAQSLTPFGEYLARALMEDIQAGYTSDKTLRVTLSQLIPLEYVVADPERNIYELVSRRGGAQSERAINRRLCQPGTLMILEEDDGTYKALTYGLTLLSELPESEDEEDYTEDDSRAKRRRVLTNSGSASKVAAYQSSAPGEVWPLQVDDKWV